MSRHLDAASGASGIKSQPEPVIVGPPCRDHPPTVVISFKDGGRRLLVGGQVAVDKDGNVVGKGDMRTQIDLSMLPLPPRKSV